MKRLLCALLAAMPLMASALDIPRGGEFDQRIREVNYNPKDITQVMVDLGSMVDIVFAEDEKVIKKGLFGVKEEFWSAGNTNNHLVFTAEKTGGDGPIKVLTNKRAYNFYLMAREAPTVDVVSRKGHKSEVIKRPTTDAQTTFQITFHYPDDEAAKRKAEKEEADLKQKLDSKTAPRNFNYWVQGSEELTPDEAYDDGTTTTLVFHGNRQIPSIFVVNEDGSESLVNRSVEGGKVMIHLLARKFVLRKGNSVTCVFNETYDPIGVENTTGTTVPNVRREIIGRTN